MASYEPTHLSIIHYIAGIISLVQESYRPEKPKHQHLPLRISPTGIASSWFMIDDIIHTLEYDMIRSRFVHYHNKQRLIVTEFTKKTALSDIITDIRGYIQSQRPDLKTKLETYHQT